ncbi:hypothetical protein [Streptomyces sp. Rer75]|uniref:hypothetical protein n=1 Tax=unclassified Streptomyces TaxID=2593676 RepID=UPI0015CF84BC|nr:hypothetical protein [Streptomyces sp. Rer75]QLH22571.1 hypothetical protein HYQ63_19750 [Streptomyces sp. Rer75]
MKHLRKTAVDLVLGEQSTHELPMLAAEALARGVDSPALRTLAGLSRADASRELFWQAMAELGFPRPDPETAWHHRMRWAAQSLLRGELSPYDASDQIYWCASHLERSPHATSVTDRFLGLQLAWEELQGQAPAVEDQMREAATALLRASPDAPRP